MRMYIYVYGCGWLASCVACLCWIRLFSSSALPFPCWGWDLSWVVLPVVLAVVLAECVDGALVVVEGLLLLLLLQLELLLPPLGFSFLTKKS